MVEVFTFNCMSLTAKICSDLSTWAQRRPVPGLTNRTACDDSSSTWEKAQSDSIIAPFGKAREKSREIYRLANMNRCKSFMSTASLPPPPWLLETFLWSCAGCPFAASLQITGTVLCISNEQSSGVGSCYGYLSNFISNDADRSKNVSVAADKWPPLLVYVWWGNAFKEVPFLQNPVMDTLPLNHTAPSWLTLVKQRLMIACIMFL